MKFLSIVAENPNDAVVQVHAQLGPDAVIVSVRKARPEGISWILPNRRKIEVTACVPEKPVEVKREISREMIIPHFFLPAKSRLKSWLWPHRENDGAPLTGWKTTGFCLYLQSN